MVLSAFFEILVNSFYIEFATVVWYLIDTSLASNKNFIFTIIWEIYHFQIIDKYTTQIILCAYFLRFLVIFGIHGR